MASRFRTTEASSLTRQASQARDKIKQDVPSQYRTELKSIVDELTGRVDFVTKGQAPRTKTNYGSLEASALAQQARHVISQISRSIPVERREGLEIIETLADRVEFAAIGSPSTTGSRSTARSTTRSTARRTTRATAGRRSRARRTARPSSTRSEETSPRTDS